VVEAAGSASSPFERLQQGDVRILRVAANGFDLATRSAGGGLVVSSVAWSRGWRLRVDGIDRPVLRVNAGFVGFLAPPGTHRIALDYRPAGWTWGCRLFALTLVALLAFVALPAARARARRTAPT
jgi:uncharacterized membrane protein YfhO